MAALKRNPPAMDLAAYAKEHLAYEAEMFASARDIFIRRATGRTGLDAEMKLLGEACLLHLRNLIDFFYPTTVRADDVIAADYAADWDKQPSISPKLQIARNRVHKELAHLTTDRKDGSAPDKDWNFGDISVHLKPVVENFIRLADTKLLPEETISVLRKVMIIPVMISLGTGPVFNSSR